MDLPISIHAPLRGATRRRFQRSQPGCISIHAPLRGATVHGGGPGGAGGDFNPRPPAGGDEGILFAAQREKYFNPRPPAGGDRDHYNSLTNVQKFQSTPPCGGRPCHVRLRPSRINYFNPRPPAGGDRSISRPMADVAISIHAPLRGATAESHLCACMSSRFQSTPPCGGRRRLVSTEIRGWRFQSTPPCGGRQQKCPKILSIF